MIVIAHFLPSVFVLGEEAISNFSECSISVCQRYQFSVENMWQFLIFNLSVNVTSSWISDSASEGINRTSILHPFWVYDGILIVFCNQNDHWTIQLVRNGVCLSWYRFSLSRLLLSLSFYFAIAWVKLFLLIFIIFGLTEMNTSKFLLILCKWVVQIEIPPMDIQRVYGLYLFDLDWPITCALWIVLELSNFS